MNGNENSLEDFDSNVVRRIIVNGIALTRVTNPYFSAFASYEAKKSGTIPVSLRRKSLSMRLQQTEAAQYFCVDSSQIQPNLLAVNSIEVSIIFYNVVKCRFLQIRTKLN